MRIRSIRPEFWRSKDISNLPLDDRLLFIGLWSYVDDNGVGRDELADIVADLFADDMVADPRETVARVSRGLARLSEAHLVSRYTVENRPFLHIVTWSRHQRVDKAAKSRYPLPDAHSRESRETVARDPGKKSLGEGEKGRRGEDIGTVSKSAATLGAATASPSHTRRGHRLPDSWIPSDTDANRKLVTGKSTTWVQGQLDKFGDYWRAISGQKGNKLDWDATWRNWVRNAIEYEGRKNNSARGPIDFDELNAQAEQWQAEIDAKGDSHGREASF